MPSGSGALRQEDDDIGSSFQDRAEALREVLERQPRWNERYAGWTVLGSGAHATVVKTYSRDLGEEIAVKVFHLLDQHRFQCEVRNARRLDCPGAVRVYSPFWGSPPWLEMEYVDGPDLRQELERREAERDPFTYLEALDIGIALAEVLVEAHRKKVVHRDIKPANILLPRAGAPRAKLVDFGVSRAEGAASLTLSGAFPGTPKFASPESFVGEEPLGPPHDIYSLGLCLYLLLTNNRFPWQIRDGAGLRFFMGVHVGVPPTSARLLEPAIEPAADCLVRRCLDKRPGKRPAAAVVLDSLRYLQARQLGIRRERRRAPVLFGSFGRRWSWRARLLWRAVRGLAAR
jgi:serine/threonine protein kinase